MSSGLFLGNSGNSENRQQRRFQTHPPPRGVIPFLQRMRSSAGAAGADGDGVDSKGERNIRVRGRALDARLVADKLIGGTERGEQGRIRGQFTARAAAEEIDRKSTRLNSSHTVISYAVFCLKKKKKNNDNRSTVPA